MIDLSANPDAVLTLEHGTPVTVNSIEFVFEVSSLTNKDGTENVFLTTSDSRVAEFLGSPCGYSDCQQCTHQSAACPTGMYADYIKHLRSQDGQAAMLRYELAEVIRTNNYEIE